MDHLLYGAAYYDEYMPCERLEKDAEMLAKAGMNVVRIAESTWATEEPQPGVFDFSHVTRVLDEMEKHSISVIIGTPTYAVPSWLVNAHPEVLAVTHKGPGIYGARQIMDITSPAYRFYAERLIRKLLAVTAGRKCVIGYQLDNETKYYDTAGPNVQKAFVRYLRNEFHDDIEALNKEFGLDYWSNRINRWEDFPDVRGTINGSLAAEFDKFRRGLVDEFLMWQANIVKEYKRPDQFITHNFDFDWRGYSFGVQPSVNHFHAANAVTLAGCDIYHPTQDELTGAEIAFGGDLTRSIKGDGADGSGMTSSETSYAEASEDRRAVSRNGMTSSRNYLVLETEAQGYPDWTPYPGQLRLQAFSHLASGANMVEYWHWHSIHNSFETYWKGVLSHDLAENAIYRECETIGADFKRLGSHLVNLKKHNQAAILVSNEALTALEYFRIDATAKGPGHLAYNDIVRLMYDALYKMNIECDFLPPEATAADMNRYRMVVAPALYAAPEDLLRRLNAYVRDGGYLVTTFKSGFADEYVKVYHDAQPHILREAVGVTYQQFTFPKNCGLRGKLVDEARGNAGVDDFVTGSSAKMQEEVGVSEAMSASMDSRNEGAALAQENMRMGESLGEDDLQASLFMELLMPDAGCEVLASYDHRYWGEYAAVTENAYGRGKAMYIGCGLSEKLLRKLLAHAAEEAGIDYPAGTSFPVIVRKGTNDAGHIVTYYLNYSPEDVTVKNSTGGTELLSGRYVEKNEKLALGSWEFAIVETEA